MLLVVISTTVVLLAGALAFTVDPGIVPNPGHALSSIQGFFQGDASLTDSLSKTQQRVAGTCVGNGSIRIVNPDGTVSCEMDIQQRITGQCPSNSIRVISATGTVECEPESAMAVVTSNCPPGQLATIVAANGTITCAEPVGTLCEYGSTGRMYSVGAKCNPTFSCSLSGGNEECTCASSGNFSCNNSGTYRCPRAC